LVGRLVREPNAEEMAKELDIPLETYFRLDQELNDATLLSIEDLSIVSEAAWERTQEKYAAASFLDPLTFVEGKDLAEKLAVAVNGLPERERMLITLYYHEELTLREIGEVFHLSEGRVSQILAQTVGRLREALGVTVNSKNNSVTKHSTGVRKARELSHQPVAEPIIQRRWNRRRIYVSHRYRNKFEKGGTLTIGEAELSNALVE
jgi:RNA polymerase sigma factor (sigma-70 family)